MQGQLIFTLLLSYAGHQQAQQPFVFCRVATWTGLEPVKGGIQTVSVRFLQRFRLEGQDIVICLTSSTDRLIPPAGQIVQHALIYPVERDLIGKRRSVIKGQRFKSCETAQQPFQIGDDDIGQHIVPQFHQSLMDIPLQIQPEVISATREGAVRLLQYLQPALLQVQPFKHGPLVSPRWFDTCFPFGIRCRDRSQRVMAQAFHQPVCGKPAIWLLAQISRQGTGLGQQILT